MVEALDRDMGGFGMLSIRLIALMVVIHGTEGVDELKFSNTFGDNMVLQAGKQNIIWGLTVHGQDRITVQLDRGEKIQAQLKLYGGNLTWSATLPAVPASFDEHVIIAHSEVSDKIIYVQNVLFGDVWLCSGQSNMEYGIAGVNNSAVELADMASYPFIRQFRAYHLKMDRPQIQLKCDAPDRRDDECAWKEVGRPTSISAGFSAVCWFYARDVYTKLAQFGKGTPIGLIETTWGGQPIEHFSSQDALNKCMDPDKPVKDSVIWNGQINPFVNTTIKGAIWYQGEANNGHPGGMRPNPPQWGGGAIDGYNCTFPAMIDDWRLKWHEGTNGQTDSLLPFGFVQLGPIGTDPNFNEPQDDPSMGEYSNKFGYAGLRWAQTAGYGYVPNPRMNNTFMATVVDTPKADGNVHTPFKQPAGSRLARAGLRVAYGMGFDTMAPRVLNINRVQNTIVVKLFFLGTGGLEIRNKTGFEVLVNDGGVQAPGKWVSTHITSNSADSITIGAIPTNASKIRYLWYSNPCGMNTYQCAIYTKVQPLGNLSGELDFLPLAPFIQDLPSMDLSIIV